MTAVAVHNDWRCIAMRSDVGRRELDMFCYQNQLNRDALEQLEDLREQYLRLIHDLGLVQYPRPAGSGRMSFARLIRPPNRPGSGFPEGFACPPPAANEHGASLGILHAAIAATMDHVIVPSATSQGDYLIGRANVSRRVEGIGHALMLIERERIAARPVDLDRGSVVHRALAHRPQYITRALVAAALSSTTTAASVKATTFATASLAMLVVFARIVEYWPKAQLLIVNRWIHCRCYAKTAVVLLAIRDKYQALLNASIARPADKLPADLAVWRSVILGVFANDCI
ncbi:hypothetical protein H4R19_005219 [Coemansia spiralis]|nr:hypothetical protein H4R19_005219 [Coemansia spiralis]